MGLLTDLLDQEEQPKHEPLRKDDLVQIYNTTSPASSLSMVNPYSNIFNVNINLAGHELALKPSTLGGLDLVIKNDSNSIIQFGETQLLKGESSPLANGQVFIIDTDLFLYLAYVTGKSHSPNICRMLVGINDELIANKVINFYNQSNRLNIFNLNSPFIDTDKNIYHQFLDSMYLKTTGTS